MILSPFGQFVYSALATLTIKGPTLSPVLTPVKEVINNIQTKYAKRLSEHQIMDFAHKTNNIYSSKHPTLEQQQIINSRLIMFHMTSIAQRKRPRLPTTTIHLFITRGQFILSSNLGGVEIDFGVDFAWGFVEACCIFLVLLDDGGGGK